MMGISGLNQHVHDVTERSCVREAPVPFLIQARAAETPDALAVVAGSRTVTYAELDGRANHLAAQLRAKGSGPDDVVGLLGGRSPEMIVGALAIWKAGAAYLPLDASYPADRTSYILGDAGCGIVLLGQQGAERVAKHVEDTIRIDPDGPRSTACPAARPAAEHLAYLIYTSGSTGYPKGVEITHASLLNLVFWHQRTFEVRPTDRASHLAAIGFDAAGWEIWPYLAAGASVHLPDDDTRNDPEALRDWLLSREVTLAFVPTPMAERLLALRWPREAPLRSMLVGGDTLHLHPPPELPFLLVNNYGPTECTVVATSGPVHPYDESDRRPPIGRPIDNTQIYILDDQLREVPVGLSGEIHIGGAGLARGYRNRPELTAERFVANPFGRGSRLYKTGDLGRTLPDGRIAFIGRGDDQIKIRGFRIEPNEIVSALNVCPGIVASAVVAADLGGGERRLIAYIVTTGPSRPTRSALQVALGARLPDYMIPATFVCLDALPLGPHGKVDRRALPEPTPANMLRDDDFREPRTEVERCVAGILEELLRVPRVGVDDNFFLLGGHSLLATQLMSRICAIFGVDLKLRTVFEQPTVAQLSAKTEELLLEKLEAIPDDEAPRGSDSQSQVVPS